MRAMILGIMLDDRRGARVDDWGGLENRCGLWATVGSNPTLSAELFLFSDVLDSASPEERFAALDVKLDNSLDNIRSRAGKLGPVTAI